MFFIIASVIVVATLPAIFMSNKTLKQLFRRAKYEVVYNIIGATGVCQDLLMKGKNKTELSTKTGKTAVITGGTRGIGTKVIKMLMQCDINVIMGCRNVEAGEKVLTQIREQGISTGTLKIFQLDISSLKSVSSFAKTVKLHISSLHYLINNAGIMYVPYAESEDGHESHFATNYLGHFYLAHLLLPLLKKGGSTPEKARIVNVTSVVYVIGEINLEDVNKKDAYIPPEAYTQSKLAQLLFSNHLNKLLRDEGAHVEAFGVHPGVVDTELFNKTFMKDLFWWLIPYFFKTPEQGAIPIVHTCLSPELEGKGGSYVSNCTVQTQKQAATDEEIQRKLFEYTMRILNVTTFGKE